jgi:toxin ParE1/3/4
MAKCAIIWLPEAIAEKDNLIDYIADRNILAALGVDQHIGQQVNQLAEFPLLGRKGRIPNTFELVISSTPFIVAYRLRENEVQILHVFHSRRNWPLKN